MDVKMQGISKKEIEIISSLEFDKRYFFTSKDIDKFAKNKMQRYNIVKNLIKKKRIVNLNRTKYYLVPIKARTGLWTEHPYVIADEICDGEDYFIGGYAAANYWRLTDQIPMQTDIYTTKRQGKAKILTARLVFHRTTKNKIKRAVTKKIWGHNFKVLGKEDSRKWIKSRN
ncbi:MAG: hypothetical protein Q8O89_04135 [Nanoarchaeota archaeon]|nr:hypothetical protein [Nanoarchaeota archaeon]